jgi:UDP-2-acetamido-3-amino-2,3-dideoxy-glucuronate N-acetyltransferase
MQSRNVAVIGGGYWGKNLVRNFAELEALHTVCDSDPRVLERYRSLPGVAVEPDYESVLRNSDVAAVVLASPARAHYAMARAALLAGKDVFVEKPLALRVHEGQELVSLAEASGRILMVGHLLEYHPALIALREMVERGDLGKLQYIYSNRLNLGKFRTEENILWSFAPHDIAAILGLVGGSLPTAVSAHGGTYLTDGVADVTLSTLEFAAGVRAHIFVSWLHPFKEQRLVVVGDRRMAEFADTDATDKLKVYDHQVAWVNHAPTPVKGEARAVAYAADEPLRLECLDFLRCIRERCRPRSDGRRALDVLRVLAACQESLEQGGAVVHPSVAAVDYYAHPTSVVEQPVTIGAGTRIWHFCHVMPGATIGRDCVLGQNVFVARNVQIGNNVKVENNVSLFEGVTLDDDVFCGPSSVFTNVINPRSHVSRKHEYRPTPVGRGASIGANAVVVCGHSVGRYAFVGAGAVVTHDVPDYALVYGNPATVQGWMCACGVRLPHEGNTLVCPACGAGYRLSDSGSVTPLEEHDDRTHARASD